MRKHMAVILILLLISIFLVGCGETFSGIGKDSQRIGKGVKTIFIRGE
jgi:predicted small secreted protein